MSNDYNQQQAIRSEKNQILILHELRPLLIIPLMSCGVFHIRPNLIHSTETHSYGASRMEDYKFVRIIPSQVMLMNKCSYGCRHGSLPYILLSSSFELVPITLLHPEFFNETVQRASNAFQSHMAWLYFHQGNLD